MIYIDNKLIDLLIIALKLYKINLIIFVFFKDIN